MGIIKRVSPAVFLQMFISKSEKYMEIKFLKNNTTRVTKDLILLI